MDNYVIAYSLTFQLTSLFQVSYSSDSTSTQSVNSTNTNIILSNLSTGVQYTIVVTAITSTSERIDDTVTGRTCT